MSHSRTHSDFLVYWTGKDIEPSESKFDNGKGTRTKKEIRKEYIERLKSILRFGLWMTEEDEALELHHGKVPLPKVPKVCFTELKLSQARTHARKYGALGIGFKRPFVIERGGGPVWYCPHYSNALHPVANEATIQLPEAIGGFLKPMGTPLSPHVEYSFYDECEWRIVYSDALEEECRENVKLVVRSETIAGFSHYFEGIRAAGNPKLRQPRFLVPITSEWLALVVYPDIQTQYLAQDDEKIQEALRIAKSRRNPEKLDPGSSKTADFEGHIHPIQMNLDDCLNF